MSWKSWLNLGSMMLKADPIAPRLMDEAMAVSHEQQNAICRLQEPRLGDLLYAFRFLLGRWPTAAEIELFEKNPGSRGVDTILERVMAYPDYANRQIDFAFDRPAHDVIVMTELVNGLRMFFTMRDTYVGMPIAAGSFEPEETAALLRLLRPGMNCLDVGANLGYYTLHMAAVAGVAGGRVFSFEPEPFVYSLLHRNVLENKFHSIVSLHNLAVGDEEATLQLRRDINPANFGGSFVTVDSAPGSQEIPVRRIDAIVPENLPIHLIKMDVEGFELPALRGMERILSVHHPTFLMEFNAPALRRFHSEAPKQVVELLASHGYRMTTVDDKPWNYDGDPMAFTNLICR